ncbi:phosphatase PAP2 family protein [Lysobacter niabensis]|uniref:phosphatase PAP2 family protein n=1 Tax=Agrilutibacter niabensis TaxID=380628 RepID=UPI00361F3519
MLRVVVAMPMLPSTLGQVELARRPTAPTARFYAHHLAWPLLAFALAAAALALFDGDRGWANRLYAWQGHAWALKSSFVGDTLVYTGGRLLSVTAWLVVLTLWILTLTRTRLAAWRRPLGYLVLAPITAALLVVWMKSWTNVDCPWDVVGYGGTRPYHGLFAMRPAGARGQCFPAAHASAGYCWLALYFFFVTTRPGLRWLGIAVPVGLGMLLGLMQQLRGAHFLSHDLWSLAICWLIALGWHAVMFGGRMPDTDGRTVRDVRTSS